MHTLSPHHSQKHPCVTIAIPMLAEKSEFAHSATPYACESYTYVENESKNCSGMSTKVENKIDGTCFGFS